VARATRRRSRLPRSVKDALHQQLGRALRRLDGTQAPRDLAVHEARKELKRARASLRLLRDWIGEATYCDANQRIRNAARTLSPVRDARVLLDLVAELRAGSKAAALRAELDLLERNLSRDHQLVRQQLLKRRAKVEDMRRTLRSVRAESRSWPAPSDESLSRAVKRMYRTSRKAFARAEANRREEILHESRKQTKYLRSALEVLSPAGDGSRIAKCAKRAKAIADALGDEHDLAMLRKKLPTRSRSRPARQGLVRQIEDRREKLQHKAIERSRHFYRRKAKAFVDSLDVHDRRS
jgi:CHAD domain-containing protein